MVGESIASAAASDCAVEIGNEKDFAQIQFINPLRGGTDARAI
jgi:hypothetical protein